MVKVLVIDDHPLLRYGLKSILETCSEFRIVGDTADIPEALAKIDELQPDIVIADIFMPDGDGGETIGQLREKCPQAKLLVLTDADNEDNFSRAIKAGARGYLLKSVELSQFIESLRLVASGNATVYTPMAAAILEQPDKANGGNQSRFNTLSEREKEVLGLVAQGASNKEIANQCYVSETTVKAHLRRILEKLEVKNRAHAVATAIEKGFLNHS